MGKAKNLREAKKAMALARRIKKKYPGYPWANYLRAAWKSVKLFRTAGR